MRKRLTDYDNPWKETLERYFPEFMALFFPKAYADIDWGYKHEFLDKELRQVTGESELGLRRVDQLVRVYRQGGSEIWVLVHVEVQSQMGRVGSQQQSLCRNRHGPPQVIGDPAR